MKKIAAHLKWFFALIPIGFFAAITAPIIYPLALFFLNKKLKLNPFWLWLDDEIDDVKTNKDWLIYCEGETNNFKYLYIWHALRNTAWNLKQLIKPKSGRVHCQSNREKIEELISDNLHRDGKKVNTSLLCLEMAAYKWINRNGLEGWNVNRGVKISQKYSTVGKSVLWYSVDGVLYYRYSIAKEIKILGKTFYFSFKMGASEKRYLLTLKFQK